MTPHHRHRFWRRCRIYFRRFRIGVWLLVLALLGVLFYLNQVGLPAFAKKRLLDRLRTHGIDLQFSRLRLRWDEGIVAENVRFGRADEPFSPHLSLGEVRVQLDPLALARLQFQVKSLALRRGRLVWPVTDAEQAPRQLSAENIQTDLRFLPGDEWALDNFRADFAGAKIQLTGTITNASAVRDWKFFHAEQPTPAAVWQERLRHLADTLERIHFSTPPELKLDVRGDARDLQSFKVLLTMNAPGAETPWGAVSQAGFTARLVPAAGNVSPRAEVTLQAADAKTRWGAATNLHLALNLESPQGATNLLRGNLTLSASRAETRWGSLSNARLTAAWLHALTNATPLSGQGEFRCERAQTQRWGKARNVRLLVQFLPPAATNTLPEADESWAGWAKLRPYGLDWECELADLQSRRLALKSLSCCGTWRAPLLTFSRLQADFAPGTLEAQAEVNVATRALRATLSSDVDPNQVAPALTEDASRWLADFAWKTPPRLKAGIVLVLPAWTNSQPDWRAEVLPTLGLEGEFRLEDGGAYRRVAVTSAHSHFVYSNQCWRLPDFVATRPEGQFQAEHYASALTREFYLRLSSTVDPRILLPVLEANQRKGLDEFTFTQPPALEAEIQGRFDDLERTGFTGHAELTNFTFRGESASGFQAELQYTNRCLRLANARLQRGVERLSAEAVVADFNAGRVYLTNGFSTAEPQVVARAIGSNIERAIEPYRFGQPPTARVYGTIPLHGNEGADLHFDLEGGPFHWWKFNLPRVAGHVHWLDQRLDLSDVRADFYGGQARGWAGFDFRPEQGADYQFSMTVSNALLHGLMVDLSDRTNRLEGRLSGTLTITRANYAQTNNVNGYGKLGLRDGLIWDIPLFGIFSPVLDGIAPGLGSARAGAATATFTITNAVIRSDDLEIRASALRLRYRGNVALTGQVNARVEAEVLRDMWVVGPLVSTVLWPVTKLFEYRVTGTLNQPKTDPVFPVPSIVLFPFHPFRSLRELLPEYTGVTRTNSPSLSPPN